MPSAPRWAGVYEPHRRRAWPEEGGTAGRPGSPVQAIRHSARISGSRFGRPFSTSGGVSSLLSLPTFTSG